MTEALKRLIEAVTAGARWQEWPANPFNDHGHLIEARGAAEGSLDAAKALHDALLPGADYSVSPSAVYVLNGYKGEASTPARAWLLAILRAKLAEADNPTASQETNV